MGMYIAPTRSTDERETPDDVFRVYDEEFHFTLDVCATPENTKCARFFTKEDDALTKDWHGVCWMNPPYSQNAQWIKKAYEESLKGATVVCLMSSATDTRWWHEYATKGEIRFIKGRIQFKGTVDKNGQPKVGSSPFPSAVIIFRGVSNGA